MNDQTVGSRCATPNAPSALVAFAEPCALLPGEDPRDYEAIRQMIVEDIQPQNHIEWLWTLDLIELSWEIVRYRRLKMSMLNTYRAAAIEATVRRLDGEGMPADAMSMVDLHAKRIASEWRDDRDTAAEIEARLRRSKFDDIDINAEVFIQARTSFEMFDRLIHFAQTRRIGLLREICLRRELARPAARKLAHSRSLQAAAPKPYG